MTNQECPNQLDWLAFCYAAGELTAADSEQFEAALACDQSAREALARAVDLTQTIAAAENHSKHFVTPAAVASRDWNSRFSWMAVGGLAALLLALLWSGVVGPTWHTAWQKSRDSSQRHLAFAWNETKTQIADVREAGLWPAVDITSDGESDFTDGSANSDEMAVEETPSWLMAAVLGQVDETGPSTESF